MVPATISFTLRNIFDRVGLTSPHQRTGLPSAIRFNRWQRMLAALGDWSAFLNLAWRSEVLLRDRPERFRRFCRDCGEDTPHDGFDEFGVGWYAQICRCRYCGGEGMRVWPLAWWCRKRSIGRFRAPRRQVRRLYSMGTGEPHDAGLV